VIALLRIHAFVRMARVLVLIGRVAEFVRAASCRKVGALLAEATALYDARDAAWRLARARR
jgi:hypothetical protein